MKKRNDDINPELRVTQGKKGIPALTAHQDHLSVEPAASLVVFLDERRIVTRIAIVCRVSDADLWDN